jgi:hypothetical protein
MNDNVFIIHFRVRTERDIESVDNAHFGGPSQRAALPGRLNWKDYEVRLRHMSGPYGGILHFEGAKP